MKTKSGSARGAYEKKVREKHVFYREPDFSSSDAPCHLYMEAESKVCLAEEMLDFGHGRDVLLGLE